MNSFERFVEGLIADKYRTASALATALGMSVSAFQRGVKGGSLGVEKCLLLAEASGVPPRDVLTLAGKGELAGIIERLYPSDAPQLSAVDRELIALPIGAKRQMLRFVHEMTSSEEQTTKRRHA